MSPQFPRPPPPRIPSDLRLPFASFFNCCMVFMSFAPVVNSTISSYPRRLRSFGSNIERSVAPVPLLESFKSSARGNLFIVICRRTGSHPKGDIILQIGMRARHRCRRGVQQGCMYYGMGSENAHGSALWHQTVSQYS